MNRRRRSPSGLRPRLGCHGPRPHRCAGRIRPGCPTRHPGSLDSWQGRSWSTFGGFASSRGIHGAEPPSVSRRNHPGCPDEAPRAWRWLEHLPANRAPSGALGAGGEAIGRSVQWCRGSIHGCQTGATGAEAVFTTVRRRRSPGSSARSRGRDWRSPHGVEGSGTSASTRRPSGVAGRRRGRSKPRAPRCRAR